MDIYSDFTCPPGFENFTIRKEVSGRYVAVWDESRVEYELCDKERGINVMQSAHLSPPNVVVAVEDNKPWLLIDFGFGGNVYIGINDPQSFIRFMGW